MALHANRSDMLKRDWTAAIRARRPACTRAPTKSRPCRARVYHHLGAHSALNQHHRVDDLGLSGRYGLNGLTC